MKQVKFETVSFTNDGLNKPVSHIMFNSNKYKGIPDDLRGITRNKCFNKASREFIELQRVLILSMIPSFAPKGNSGAIHTIDWIVLTVDKTKNMLYIAVAYDSKDAVERIPNFYKTDKLLQKWEQSKTTRWTPVEHVTINPYNLKNFLYLASTEKQPTSLIGIDCVEIDENDHPFFTVHMDNPKPKEEEDVSGEANSNDEATVEAPNKRTKAKIVDTEEIEAARRKQVLDSIETFGFLPGFKLFLDRFVMHTDSSDGNILFFNTTKVKRIFSPDASKYLPKVTAYSVELIDGLVDTSNFRNLVAAAHKQSVVRKIDFATVTDDKERCGRLFFIIDEISKASTNHWRKLVLPDEMCSPFVPPKRILSIISPTSHDTDGFAASMDMDDVIYMEVMPSNLVVAINTKDHQATLVAKDMAGLVVLVELLMGVRKDKAPIYDKYRQVADKILTLNITKIDDAWVTY